MIYDKDFLLELDKVKEKEIYAKVTALTFQETPITTIEGRITTGSINVDGNSAVRRTCSLTFIAQNFDYSNYFWGLNTKFKLEIGVKNNININYPDIIWFPQGIFILTSFNTSRSATNYSISLQGKDKMCLLNGEVGGSIESSVDFGVEEIVNELGYIELKKIPIPEIIRNMVHHYAGEPYYNIIINDLEEYGLELLEYRYDDDLYLYRSINSIYFDNILINPDTPCSVNGKPEIKKLSDLTPNELDLLVDTLTGTPNPSIVEMEGNEYYVAKVKFGQTAGYRETDLVYAGDLIANIGESITSVLDKIKTMLSDFEYFYNLDGQFVFQRKQAFINTLWSPISHETKDQEQYVESLAISSAYSYIFSGAELITSFNNNPNLLNMRNDYSIWGTREGIGRQDPVHMRYAIDTKPVYYKTIDGRIYISDKTIFDQLKSGILNFVDWREIIYQMALDYFKYGTEDDFEIRIRENNLDYYPRGLTGYEQYYTDIQDFWRYLYNPELNTTITNLENKKANYDDIIFVLTQKIYSENDAKNYIENNTIIDNLPENIPLIEDMIRLQNDRITKLQEKDKVDYQQIADYQMYLSNLQSYLGILTSTLKKNEELSENMNKKIENSKTDLDNYYSENDEHPYWNKTVYEFPEQLYFWFDFLDDNELTGFNAKTVGARPKVINDTAVKSIYFRETPDVIFVTAEQGIGNNSAFKYIQANDIEGMFRISAQGKSAKDRLDELIYSHGYCIENITINAIPIYYLQPNTRIYLFDEKSGLNGDYIISKITIPLGYNGTMQITATKAAENII